MQTSDGRLVIAFDGVLKRAQFEAHARQRLQQAVVQIAREPDAFLARADGLQRAVSWICSIDQPMARETTSVSGTISAVGVPETGEEHAAVDGVGLKGAAGEPFTMQQIAESPG